MNQNEAFIKPDKREAAVCGLFCPACTIFIATKEDPDRLKRLAERRNQSEEDLKCQGCRSEKRTGYCKTCKMAECASKKGIDFCGECEEYPCEDLKQFQVIYPHRIELWQSQIRIKEVGFDKWYQEMVEHYSCTECGTLNSAYDTACRKCGTTPSCEYVDQNQSEIMKRLKI
jgi:ribosomal protein L40E